MATNTTIAYKAAQRKRDLLELASYLVDVNKAYRLNFEEEPKAHQRPSSGGDCQVNTSSVHLVTTLDEPGQRRSDKYAKDR